MLKFATCMAALLAITAPTTGFTQTITSPVVLAAGFPGDMFFPKKAFPGDAFHPKANTPAIQSSGACAKKGNFPGDAFHPKTALNSRITCNKKGRFPGDTFNPKNVFPGDTFRPAAGNL